MHRLLFICLLLCTACNSGRDVMLAPPAEPPEAIAIPPAVMPVGGSPSMAPALELSPAALSSDATEITVEDQDSSEQPQAPRATANQLFHFCRSGESVEDVAAAHGVDAAALMQVNGLGGGRLRQGMVVLLPRPLDNVSMAPDVTTYNVVAGDNFSRIARIYHLTTTALMRLNQTESSDLQIGDVLYVPNPGQ
jgi:LysM repeat protein